jgi:hypothetical protein
MIDFVIALSELVTLQIISLYHNSFMGLQYFVNADLF